MLVSGPRQIRVPEPTPALLGRYVVLGEVGRGGMGRVVRAYDPKLERIVALKCLRLDTTDGDRQSAARVIREARLMARLSHPNVVPVYDVEQADETLFVAMEFVAGLTLRDWLARRPDQREILAVLADAGRGLAAAHDAGIVHRDFKATNVMVGKDGRARVMDFGISRVSDEHVEHDPSGGLGSPPVSSDDLRTEVGTVVGTPIYMAPEQQEGRTTDARSDQYSFCLVLFEAVYGARPYAAREPAALLELKRAGPPQQPLRHGVPRRIVELIARGLAPDPQQRWPSMHALVERMGPALWQRSVQVAATTAVIAAVATGAYIVGRNTQAERCDLEPVHRAWDGEARTELRDAVAESPGASAEFAARVVEAIDRYTEDLTEVIQRRCTDEVLADASPRVREGASRCLEHAQTAMVATIRLLRRRGSSIGPRAFDAVLALPEPRACIDPARLRAVAPTPDDPGVALEVRRLRAVLAEAKALQDAGEYAAALADLRTQRAAIDATAHDPLVAEFLLREGSLLQRSGDYSGAIDILRQGYFVALAGAHDAVALETATALVEVHGAMANFDGAAPWVEHAQAWLARVGVGGREQARVIAVVAGLDSARGRYAEARKGLEQAIELLEQLGRGEHPDVAALHDALGGVLLRNAQLDAAVRHHARALAIRETVLGSEHPEVATTLDNLGIAAKAQGRLPEAIDLHTRALAIREHSLGTEHPEIATGLVNLGTALERAGELPAARAHLERAAALIERALGPMHPQLGAAQGNLGNIEYALERWPQALAHYERAASIFRSALGDDHPDVAMAYHNVGLVAMQLGRHDLARSELERARAVWERSLGPEHPLVAMVLATLGENAHAAGRDREAVVPLQRALEILRTAVPSDERELLDVTTTLGAVHVALGETDAARERLEQALVHGERLGVGDDELAIVRFELARVLWSHPGTRARAHALATAAREDAPADARAAIDAWRADHVR